MKHTCRMIFALAMAGSSLFPVSELPAQSESPAIVFQHAAVVDVKDGALIEDQTVVIDRGRITVVAPDKSAKAPANALVVDASGKFLIPGLWDMHVHAAWPGLDQIVAPLFVANGVTGVREMYGSPFVIGAWKQKYQSGEWPRMIGAGHILDGPKPFWPGSTVATTADEARQAVDKLHQAGADFIKVYTKLPREAYFAALDEAKKVGTYAAGHVPDAVSVAEASDHGQRAIEHLTGVALECSKEADALRKERAAAASDTSVTNLLKTYLKQSERVLASQDAARASELFAKLARNRTWQVPTLTVLRSMAMLDDSTFTADARVRYMPEQVVKSWDWRSDFRFRMRKPEDWANGKKMYRLNLDNVGKMSRAGVLLLAGTDMLNPYTFPGFSLHDELSLLSEAGLSPAEALRAATLNPAMFMNATDSLGTVEAGKRADLVLLDANPLSDIRNTQKVRAVVLNGRYYDRAALDAMIAGAEKQARP